MWKTLLTKFGPILLVAVFAVMLKCEHNRAEKYHNQSNTLEATITDLHQEVKQTWIRLNDSITLYQVEVKALNFTKDNLKAKYDRLLAASKVKPKDVSNVTEIVSVVHSIDTVIAEVDTFGGIKASVADQFVTIDVEVKPDRKTIFDYEVRDSLTVINVQKKHSWLFGLIKWKEHKTTRVINHNPKARITDLQTIDVVE